MNILELLDKTTDELYFDLGDSQIEKGIFPHPYDEIVEEGKKWWSKNLSKVKEKICVSSITKEVITESNRIRILTSIADIISAFFVGVPPFVIAALILKIGLEDFCEIDNSKKDKEGGG